MKYLRWLITYLAQDWGLIVCPYTFQIRIINRIRKYILFFKIFLFLDFWKCWTMRSKNIFLITNGTAFGTLFCFILTWSRSQTSAPQIAIVHSYKKYSCFYYIVIIHIALVNKCSLETTLIFVRTFSESIFLWFGYE